MRDVKLAYIKNKLSELQYILDEVCRGCSSNKPCSECLLTKAKQDVKTIRRF